MKITSKGQVTIPRAIRERLGLLPGTQVEVIVRGEVVQIVKRGAAIVSAMRGRMNAEMSTDEVSALTRDDTAGWKPA